MPLLCEPWADGAAVLTARAEKLADVNPTTVDDAATMASEILFLLSARKFPGRCRATIRPAAHRAGYSVASWAQMLGGFVSSWGYCGGGDHRSCLSRGAIDLGVYPLLDVEEVILDGQVLDNADNRAYRVDSDRYLVRLDGGGWPTCQDPRSDPAVAGSGAFAVTAVYGQVPPQAGISAAITLACEFALSWSNKSSKLPARLSRISRQGVEWQTLDPMTFLDRGRTGLYDVDLFLAAANPHGQRGRPAVLSPDLDRSRRTSPITAGGSNV